MNSNTLTLKDSSIRSSWTSVCNRTKPRVLVYNQQTRELISAQNMQTGRVMYLVLTRMPGESDSRRLGSLSLYLCCVF